ncbi:MAG: ATP synthase F1 subunit gamma [Planctomycetota bacterium]|nr:ATP synthase F1 subunit gamma [Planctomycetota bacterium]
MASPRAILKRTKSVKNIAKITKTMQMIATAKFKRAFDRAVAARPYTDKLTRLIGKLAEAAGSDYQHPLLEKRPPKRAVLLAISSNRGLCGGFNSNVTRAALLAHRGLMERDLHVETLAFGKRVGNMLRFKKIKPDRIATHIEDKPTFADVDVVALDLLERYAAGEIDEVHVAYTKFVSTARQTAVVERILPLETPADEAPRTGPQQNFVFHPSAEQILSDLLPRSVRLHLFQAFLDSAVSEQTARMVAMKSATDNANDMIRDLTMLYNRSRQTQITTELSEIIGGSAALE